MIVYEENILGKIEIENKQMMQKPNIKREGDFGLNQLLADEKISSFDLLFTLNQQRIMCSSRQLLPFFKMSCITSHVGKGKVSIQAKWPIRPELIPVSVT